MGLGRDPFGGEGVHHHDGRDREHADGIGLALGDLGRDRGVVGGVDGEVDRLELHVEQDGQLLHLGRNELQRGVVWQDEQEVLGTGGLGGGDATHPHGDPTDRREGVLVGQLVGRRAPQEDARQP